MWHLYLVECKDGSIYTGISTDVTRRVGQHNDGSGAKYTRSRRPVILLCSVQVGSRGEAQSIEAKVKKLSRTRKREVCALISSGADYSTILSFVS